MTFTETDSENSGLIASLQITDIYEPTDIDNAEKFINKHFADFKKRLLAQSAIIEEWQQEQKEKKRKELLLELSKLEPIH